MGFLDFQHVLVPPRAPVTSDDKAFDMWRQFQVQGSGQTDAQSLSEHNLSFKKQRTSEESVKSCGDSKVIPLNNLPVNTGTSNIFFKTRICAKFKTGSCRNGENCNFAHGMQDLRQPPSNWQELVGVSVRIEDVKPLSNWDDDQRIIHKMKLCKKFCSGGECPYGEKCNFIHEDPAKFRDDTGRFRGSSVINIETRGLQIASANGDCAFRTLSHTPLDAPPGSVKPPLWKTKLCMKWQTLGQCPFGEKCYFAHGFAELQVLGIASEEAGTPTLFLQKPPPLVSDDAPPSNVFTAPCSSDERLKTKCLWKWKGPKKINKIYADWLDDLPLVCESST